MPAAAASLVTRKLKTMLLCSVSLSILSGIAGLYLSFYADLPSGPAIVLCLVGAFALSYLLHALRAKAAKSSSP
jgi:ABC-type Mn2+/Zn2+ transport system permease subunit